MAYATLLDVYMYILFFLLAALAIVCFVIDDFDDPNLNWYSLWVYVALGLLMNVIAAVVVLLRFKFIRPPHYVHPFEKVKVKSE